MDNRKWEDFKRKRIKQRMREQEIICLVVAGLLCGCIGIGMVIAWMALCIIVCAPI